ncbi:MAG: hypothetical protein KatS3mg008_1469 [Acidimicrobiales bacterium]|nr:MAG: hypothetical protein KatS3mg008_1469 [Acidimicrobiales bacterium]
MPEGGLPSVFRERVTFPGEGRLRGLESERSAAPVDPVTGLPSRAVLADALSEATLRSSTVGRRSALVILAVLNLREISEVFGFAVGDQVLAALAVRLKAGLRGDVKLLRHGGAEFALVVAGLSGRDEAESIAASLLRLAREPLEIGRWSIHLSVCAAVTLSSRRYGDHEQFAKAAASALTRARELGHGSLVLEDADRRGDDLPQVDEHMVRVAVDEQQFTLAYQPVVDPASGEVRGAEALLRWRLDDGREVPTSVFLPILEKSGMIIDLTAWQLMQVAGAAAEIRRSHPQVDCPVIFVNVGPQQLTHARLPEVVEAACVEHSPPPRSVCLDITERALRLRPRSMWDTFRRVRDLGVSLALDDFGVGTSSFEFLRDQDVDYVQISRFFARGLGDGGMDDVVVRHLVEAALEIGLVPVVEGVERESQARWLAEIGCPLAQGYLWGEAMSLEELRRKIDPAWTPPEDGFAHPADLA